jgi:hypothetical protein
MSSSTFSVATALCSLNSVHPAVQLTSSPALKTCDGLKVMQAEIKYLTKQTKKTFSTGHEEVTYMTRI